jgi:hypothetical protein
MTRGSTNRDRLGRATVGVLVAAAAAGALGACGSGDDSTVAIPVVDGGGTSASDAKTDQSAGDAHAGAADATINDSGDGAPGKAAHASFAAGPINLGPIGCGGAPATENLGISNTGGSPLTVSASEVGAAFSVSPAALTIAPAASGTLAITATAPASAVAGTPLTGSLSMFTNDPTSTTVSLLLSAMPTGATLSGATEYSFASTEVGVAAPPVALELKNVGNAAATFTIGLPSDPSIAIAGIDGTTGVLLGPGDTWSANATFTPTAASSASGINATSTIAAEGTICGSSVSSLGFIGHTAAGTLIGWPSNDTIDFGPARCGGAAPAAQTMTLTNTGTTGARVSGVDTSGIGGFSTDAATGALIAPNGGMLTITVRAPSVPPPSAATPSLSLSPVTGDLVIHTDADATPQGTSIHLMEEPQGAILAFGSSTTPSCTTAENFGDFTTPLLLLQTAPPQSFCVVNSGNLPANVALSATENPTAGAVGAGNAGVSGNDADDADATAEATAESGAPPAFSLLVPAFTLPPPASSTIPSVEEDSLTFQPAHANATVGSLTMMVDSTTALCQLLPSALPLSGNAIGGGPVVTPTALTFAPTCHAAAPDPQTFVVSNSGTVDLTWTMTGVTGPGAGDYKIAANPPPGVLIPGASSTITVTASQFPFLAPDPDAALTVDTDVPGDPAHVVTLNEVPLGDAISVSVDALRFGQVPLATSIGQSFTLTNSANAGSPDAKIALGLVAADGGVPPYTLSPQATTASLPAGGSVSETVTFDPSSQGSQPATLTFATTDPLCSPLPAPLALSGTGTSGSVSLSAASLTFGQQEPPDPEGLVNCGATGVTQTLTIANVGNQAFNVTSVTLGKGSISPFALSGSATATPAVAIGGTTSLSITPAPIPQVADPTDTSAFTDTLTIATDAAGDTPHTVALIMQARGAVIADTPFPTTWTFGTIGAGSIGTFTTSIRNMGNADAIVSLDGLLQPDVFGLRNNPTTVPGQSATELVGEFTPPSASGTWTDQAQLLVTAPDGFCAPLPTQWTGPTVDLSGSSNANPIVTDSGSLVLSTSSPPSDAGADAGNSP